MFFAVTTPTNANAGCCLHGGFWIDHQDMWPEGFTPESELCGMSFGEILQTPSNGRPWHALAHQWITAQLNVANGAVSKSLGTALEDAETLLNKADFSQKPKHIYTYMALAGILADHNNGVLSHSKRCPHDITVVCPPCPACCCPECPACPACECGNVECNCPEQAECVCNCAPQITGLCKSSTKSSSKSHSSCSSHKHGHHHKSHHHKSHHHKHHDNAVKNVPATKKLARAKRSALAKKRVHARKSPGRNRPAQARKEVERKRTITTKQPQAFKGA